MKQIQKQVVKWHREVFPKATKLAIITKLKEELDEAVEAVDEYNDIRHLAEELADVVIVACSLLDRFDIDFEEVIFDKMEVNKNRVWGEEMPDGSRERVR